MKFEVGGKGITPHETYTGPVSCTKKATWSDRDANSGPQWWEVSD